MTAKQPNRLVNENSPYLLQHAYNPVNWHPWDEVALDLAASENKLLIISIGYAACHWCHVMEDESFENEEVALAMNRDFISIKVDREERPDIDHVYMSAAYATTGRGGWPLNVIALPDRRPLFAGTYYSTQNWLQILHYFSELFHNRPEELLHHAGEIANGMKRHDHLPVFTPEAQLSESFLHNLFSTWEDDLDFTRGGTHGAPKFPMPVNLLYLLTYGKRFRHKNALDYVEVTLDRMSMGGIFDQIGGGFSRYSVDAEWNVPHFEKMLYDNAQLITLYSQAYMATGKQAYKQVVEKTAAFIEREMTSSGGLFYASLDADSEGTEGAFYAWKPEEISACTGSDSELVAGYYTCTAPGNWENGWNVLRRSLSDHDFAAKHGLSADDLTRIVQTANRRLFEARNNRIRPATDDKILTCWNALMISALTEAARAFNHPLWLEKAVTAARFYRDGLEVRNEKLWRNSKSGGFFIAGFLDDYCFLIKAFLDLYQATFDQSWLEAADRLTQKVLRHFNAAGGLFFTLTSDEEPRLISETVELTDNVIPASNSQMAMNLFLLGHLLHNDDYLKRSEKMVQSMIPLIQRNPAFHANWAGLLMNFITGPREVTIAGDEKPARLQEFAGYYLPGVIYRGNSSSSGGKTLITVCTGKTCHAPVETVHEAVKLLEFGLKKRALLR